MTTTEKLEAKVQNAFAKLGIVAENFRVTYPKGVWKRADVYRWEGSIKLWYPDGRQPRRALINSWDSATRCVKKGEILLEEDENCYQWLVWAPDSLIK